MLTFLKSERAIDYLRWIVAFVAVVSTYGVAAWLVLRPTGRQLDVNAPVVEINLRDLPQPSAIPPSDRASEPRTPANPTGDNAQSGRPGSADTAPRAAGGSASRADAGDAVKDANAVDAKDGLPVAAKTAASDKAENPVITQPSPAADATPGAPPKTEPPAADSGGGGRPAAAPARLAKPDTSAGTAASIERAPIDTSVTVNQGRSLLRSTKGRPQFSGLPLPQLRLAPPLLTPKDRNEPFSKKPTPLAGLALPAIGLAPPAANHGNGQDLAQKPATGADGGLARNAIGIIIERRAVVPHAGAPLGVQPVAGATSTAMHASVEHGPATTAVGASLAAGHASPRDAGLSIGAANPSPAGHPDRALQANHVALIGGPAATGTGVSRPASRTGAVGSTAKVATGGLNGSSFRPRYP